MAFANGIYNRGYMGDLGCCGCQTAPAQTAGAAGLDLSGVPMWVWIAAAAGAFLLLSKKQR